jgi:hypothetical protein
LKQGFQETGVGRQEELQEAGLKLQEKLELSGDRKLQISRSCKQPLTFRDAKKIGLSHEERK